MEIDDTFDDVIEGSGVEVTINDLVDRVKTRSSKMNMREIDLGNWYNDEKQKMLLGTKWQSEMDYYCDNKACGKTQRDLVLDWEEKQIKRMRKGKKREVRKVKTFWIVNEIQGRGLHSYIRDKNGKLILIQFGNINRLCRSCNFLYHTHKTHMPHTEKTAEQIIISHNLRGGYHDLVNDNLVTAEHLCKMATFNKYSTLLGGTQDTMEQTFKQYYGIEWDLIDLIKDYKNIECKYKFCDGEHIINIGKPPKQILTNYQAEQKEIEDLAKKQGSPADIS